jgi:hypothetical protein
MTDNDFLQMSFDELAALCIKLIGKGIEQDLEIATLRQRLTDLEVLLGENDAAFAAISATLRSSLTTRIEKN